jgi:hypothetical protein
MSVLGVLCQNEESRFAVRQPGSKHVLNGLSG